MMALIACRSSWGGLFALLGGMPKMLATKSFVMVFLRVGVGLGLQGRFDGFLECRPAGQAATAVKLVKAVGNE
jgi:hypothetical protein